MMKLGIVQGRLSPPEGDFIQLFPRFSWREEFPLAKRLGASHIEWIVTPGSNMFTTPPNPLFTERPPTDVAISGICMDDFISPHFKNHTYRVLHMDAVFARAAELGIDRVVLPLLEDASVREPELRLDVLDEVAACMARHPSVDVSLETDLDTSNLLSAVRYLGIDRCFITLDLGNLTKQGQDEADHASTVLDHVDGLHIKDCTSRGQTVRLGTGATPLSDILPWVLRAPPNLRWVTFQTARDPGPTESDTFRHNCEYIEGILSGSSGRYG